MNTSGDELEDEFVDEEAADSGPATVARLREKLKKAIEEKQEYLDGWQRARADFANFKRDESGRSIEVELRTKTELGEAIIPAVDALEMALQDKNLQSGDENFRKGIEAVYSNLLKSLDRIDIVRFDPTGEPFNPYHHEALREVPTSEKEKDHTVESVHRAGFKISSTALDDDRIVRPAQVSVYSHTS